jgi:hypothetical protein
MPLKYQWYRNVSTPVAGATMATLTIANVNAGNVGSYSLTVTNTAGRIDSAAATVALLPAPANTYEGQVVADGPEAYWRLNDTYDGSGVIIDSMGRHNGTAHSFGFPDGGAYLGFGQAGALADNADTCIQFTTGYQNMIRAPYSAALNPTNFTVECWANLASGPGAGTWFAPVGSANNTMGYAIYAGGDEVTWQGWLYLNPGWGVLSGPNWQLSQWVHLALTYEGLTESLYVNGTLVGSQLRVQSRNTEAPFNIGGGANNQFPFDGLIDEVACYPKALSAARINAHYALAAYGNNSLPVFIEPPASQTVSVGSTATFTATVTGAPTIAYQWKKDGVDIPGANSPTLSVPNTYYTDSGHQYSLAATNGVGGTVSLSAMLTVMPPSSQTNLVFRAKVGTSGSVLEIIWPAGTLYSAPAVTGPWTAVGDAALPYYTISPTNAAMFFRCE